MKPRCPLCGASTTWKYWHNRPNLNNKIPDECRFCKAEEGMHEKNWIQGIDVTQFGGGR